jgi:Iron-containing redox enzyme
LFVRLDAAIAKSWARLRSAALWQHVASAGCDRELYRVALTQIFHYTRHNSINQAVAAFRADPAELALLRFVYKHAKEELGHERFIVHDLESAGLLADGDELDEPLAATDALIHYLYGVALREGPIPRLGYSYWAESAYAEIAPLIAAARTSLALSDSDMTFFVAHSVLDRQHIEEVKEVMCRAITTPEQARAVERVALTSLWLTQSLLEQAFEVTRDAANEREGA